MIFICIKERCATDEGQTSHRAETLRLTRNPMSTDTLSHGGQPSVPTRMQLGSRILASLVGGYTFVWGFVALGTVAGVLLGMSYGEAQTLVFFFAFLLFAAALCWAFVARSALQVWAVLGGGGGLMTGLAWLGTRSLL
jgi:hypothetical protein